MIALLLSSLAWSEGSTPEPTLPLSTLGGLSATVEIRPAVAMDLRFVVEGLVDAELLHLHLRPDGPGMVVEVRERADWVAHLARTDEGWAPIDGEPVLTEALNAWLRPGEPTEGQGWLLGERPVLEQRTLQGPPGGALGRVNRCSCPQTIHEQWVATDRALAEDGWPLLVVSVTEELAISLGGGSQHWGGSRGSWARVSWVREGSGLTLPSAAAQGEWSQMPSFPTGMP